MRLRTLKKVVWGGIFLLLAEVSPLPFPSFLLSAQAFDPVVGQKVFLRCKACHTIEKEGVNTIGPNLWGVVGRTAGTKAGFPYSEAMKKFGKKWDVATLDAYLTKPKAVVPGGRMNFVGLRDAKQRADVIAYLNSKSDKPIRLSVAKDSKAKEQRKKDKKDERKKDWVGDEFWSSCCGEVFSVACGCGTGRDGSLLLGVSFFNVGRATRLESRGLGRIVELDGRGAGNAADGGCG